MKTLLYLALCWCAIPALAQPQPVEAQIERYIQATPQEAIELSVRDFVRETNQGSFDADQSRIADARRGYFGAQNWLRDYAENKPFEIEVRKVEPLKLEDQNARVKVTYRLNPTDFSAPLMHSEVLELKRGTSWLSNPKTNVKARIWQIVPPATRPNEPKNETEKDFDWLSYLSWKLAQKPLAPTKYAPQQSLENLKLLCIAAAQFSQDYNSLAMAPEYTDEALNPYVKSHEVFFVPNSYERYAFNANLSGRFVDNNPGIIVQPPANYVAKPENVVLFYEGRDEKLNFRYEGRAAVGFADGHAALVSPEEAKNLRWQP